MTHEDECRVHGSSSARDDADHADPLTLAEGFIDRDWDVAADEQVRVRRQPQGLQEILAGRFRLQGHGNLRSARNELGDDLHDADRGRRRS